MWGAALPGHGMGILKDWIEQEVAHVLAHFVETGFLKVLLYLVLQDVEMGVVLGQLASRS